MLLGRTATRRAHLARHVRNRTYIPERSEPPPGKGGGGSRYANDHARRKRGGILADSADDNPAEGRARVKAGARCGRTGTPRGIASERQSAAPDAAKSKAARRSRSWASYALETSQGDT